MKHLERSLLVWLINSRNGEIAANQVNNHKTWCAVEVAALALSTGHPTSANEAVASMVSAKAKGSIAQQILASGKMSYETAREYR